MTRADLLTEIIDAVATADGVDPVEVDPIYDYIDPEILNKLDEQEKGGSWRFTFQFADHQVTVTHDSQILIDGQLYGSTRSVK